MKTQLLYLDPHDDTASTREKLRWVQADRVVLVWPSHGRVLQRRVDLILLKREAARQAAQLGVLSHDPDVRAHARDLDLPLFDDLDTIPPEAWPAAATSPEAFPSRLAPGTALQIRPARPTQAARRRWDDARRAGWMLVVILALLALSVVVGPAAVIELTPESRLSLAGMQVVFAAEPPPQEGTVWIPARRLQVEVQGELRLPTEGTVPADVASAEGFARFSNRDEAEHVLPEGSGVRTMGSDPVRFETTEQAVVPAGIGSAVLVPIRAAEAGEAGNVAANSIVAVEGPLGLLLTVSNPEPTAGGVTQIQAGVTASDLRRAEDGLERQLLQEANAVLLEQVTDGEALAPGSVAVARIVDSDHRPQVGEPSESVLATLALSVEGMAYDHDRLVEEGMAALQQRAGLQNTIVAASVRVDLIPLESETTADARFYHATISGESYLAPDAASLVAQAAGMPVEQAQVLVANQADLRAPPVIRMWPRWWPRLPVLPWRIQLVWTSGT